VVVATQPATQLDRLVAQRGMEEGDARARIAAQAPLADKLARATHVIWNEGTLEELRARTDEVFDQLTALADEQGKRDLV
jgi:dephospho-CoA kinase